MFDRIANVIETPSDNESFILIDGTKINKETVQKFI
jgi:hypothetical protein